MFPVAMELLLPLVLELLAAGNGQSGRAVRDGSGLKYGILIPESASMVYAWTIPQDPRLDTGRIDAATSARILRGFELFTNTYKAAPRFARGKMTCNNCHPNGGQRDRALPLVGIARAFPEYNKRSGRVFSLEERIVGCFLRSVNAAGGKRDSVVLNHENDLEGATLNSSADEVRDIAAYIRWLSPASAADSLLPWRGHNQIPAQALIPVGKLNPGLGRTLFLDKCANCHGRDGQGEFIGDKRPGPLWGPDSWNDGAGAARVYTLAGMIRHWMPYLNPGCLTDEEAQHIAAFIISQPRPGFPFKSRDYLKEKIPTDAVCYKQLYSVNPLTGK
ncbi:MAG TPA: c-type cytochrome [Bacteroidota bacterium]|nr:c-type cytochrome [Bacteroidota bacterium]